MSNFLYALVGKKRATEGNPAVPRLGVETETIVSNLNGKYSESVREGDVFFAGNQAAQAITVALATTYTGVCVSNPVGSPVELHMLKASYALSVAPAAIAPLGFITGYDSDTNVTHTNALTVQNCRVGGPAGHAKADDQATLPTAPVWSMMFLGGFTAAALFATSPAVIDLDGIFVVPPGGYICFGALTAVTGFGSITWKEVKL